jgi:hypothetical protein
MSYSKPNYTVRLTCICQVNFPCQYGCFVEVCHWRHQTKKKISEISADKEGEIAAPVPTYLRLWFVTNELCSWRKCQKLFYGLYGGQWRWPDVELPCFILWTLYNRLHFPKKYQRSNRATQQEKLWHGALMKVLRANGKMVYRPRIPSNFQKSSGLLQEITKLNRKSKDRSKYKRFVRNKNYTGFCNKISYLTYTGDTQRRRWLRHCVKSRKVAGSIPDVVIGFFYWHNPSGRTMALGLTQPLTEMSTRNVFWG